MRLPTAKTSERAEWKHRHMGYGRLSSLVISVGKKPIVKHYNKKKWVTEMLSDEQFALIWNPYLEPAMTEKKFRGWCKRSHCKEACLCCAKMPLLRSLVKQNDKVLSSKRETRDKSKQGCVDLFLLVMICLTGIIGAKLLVGNQGVEKQSQSSRKRDTSPRKYIGRKVKFRIVRKKWCVQQLHGWLVAIFRGKKITWVKASVRNHEGSQGCKYKRKNGSELLCISATPFSVKVLSVGMERKIWSQRQKNTNEGRSYNCLWDHKIWLLKITQQKKKKKMIKARQFAAFTRRRAVSMFKYGGQKESISLVTVDLAEFLLGRKDHKVQRDIKELLSWETMETVARYGVVACRVTQEYEDSTLDSGYNMIFGWVIPLSKHAPLYGRKQHHIGWVEIRYPLRIAEGGEGIVRQMEFTLPNYEEDAEFTGCMVEDAVKRNRQRERYENLFDLAVSYVLFGAPRPPEQSVIAKSFRDAIAREADFDLEDKVGFIGAGNVMWAAVLD